MAKRHRIWNAFFWDIEPRYAHAVASTDDELDRGEFKLKDVEYVPTRILVDDVEYTAESWVFDSPEMCINFYRNRYSEDFEHVDKPMLLLKRVEPLLRDGGAFGLKVCCSEYIEISEDDTHNREVEVSNDTAFGKHIEAVLKFAAHHRLADNCY